MERAFLKIGTEKGTRTPTAYGHYHLKVACLPIPPPRQNRLLHTAHYFTAVQEPEVRPPLQEPA